nr:RNA-dependent RNA polymerase [Zyryana toti-like virus]
MSENNYSKKISHRLGETIGQADTIRNHCGRLVSVCQKLLGDYKGICHDISSEQGDLKRFGTLRMAWFSENTKRRYIFHPCGGHVLYTDNRDEYEKVKDCRSQRMVNVGERQFFGNYDPKTLISLGRYKKTETTGVNSTFAKPLVCYRELLRGVHGTEVTVLLLDFVLRCVRELEYVCVSEGIFVFIDDIVRQFLSEVDKETFLYCQVNEGMSQVFTNLHGLSTMGGPRGWTKESVDDTIKHWVTGERRFAYEDNDFVMDKLNRWMDSWCLNESPDGKLTFEQFVTDPMRWATGGGAKKVKISIAGEEVDVRNKWMWSLSKLIKGEDIIESARSEGSTAQVALKEEVKTRCVITTPQLSYLRQCYMLYRLGNPAFLKSTIVDANLTNHCANTTEGHFICVDSSQFDHTVSKSFIITFMEMLEKRVSPDLAAIIREEIEDMVGLKIMFGDKEYKYENGLLSGWRITSLLGSVLSALLCEYINEKLGREMFYITQGDDIIMASRAKLDKDLILRCCSDFGVITNSKKTTIGRFGEFLKYRYGNGHVQGYAARAVRSIFYANPWLDSTVVQSPQEVANKWFMVISRVMNSANGLFVSREFRESFEKQVVNDVFGWIGRTVSRRDIHDCLYTPGSLGGLGMFEWSKLGTVGRSAPTQLRKINVMEKSTFKGDDRFLELFGGPKDKKYIGKEKEIKTSVLSIVYDYYVGKTHRFLTNTSKTVGELVFGDQYNIFRTILTEVGSCRTSPPIIRTLLKHCVGPITTIKRPRFLEKSNRWIDVLQWMTGKDMKHSCPSSLFVGTRYDSLIGRSLQNIASLLYYNLPNVTGATKLAMSIMSYDVFRRGSAFLHAL